MGRQPRPQHPRLRMTPGTAGDRARGTCFGAGRLLMLPRQLPPQRRLWGISATGFFFFFFFFKFRTRNTWAEPARSREMLQGDRAASPQARGTRGGAVAACCARLLLVIPGVCLSSPSGASGVAGEVRPSVRPAQSSCSPQLPATITGLSPGEARISSVPRLRR